MIGGMAFDLIFSPLTAAGAGSALATTGDGGVAGLGIGSATRGAGFGSRDGIEGGCVTTGLEGPAGGCVRSACRLVTLDDSLLVPPGLEGGIGPFSTGLAEGTDSLQTNLYSSTPNPVSQRVSIIFLTPLQPFSSLIPLALFFFPLQKSAKSWIFLIKFLGM